jgi:YidC/Oxa1 family membrane protein insertase
MNFMTPVLVALTHFLDGSLGWAIVSLSLVVRIALLPLAIRSARRSKRHQALLKVMQPHIDDLKQRHEKNPEKMMAELKKLYQKHEFTPFDAKTILPILVQLPVGMMLYRSIRSGLGGGGVFFWIKNLAAPDLGITAFVTALALVSSFVAPAATLSGPQHTFMILVQVAVTTVIVAKLASGIALYWAASSAVGIGQSLWLRYVPEE